MKNYILVGLACLSLSCNQLPDQNTSGGHSLVELKARGDGYISTNARAFLLTGTVHTRLDDNAMMLSGSDRDAAVAKAVKRRMSTLSRAVKKHLDRVLSDAGNGLTGEKAQYFTYFRSAGRDQSHTLKESADGTLSIDFELEFVGSVHLMSLVSPGASTYRTFEVTLNDWSGQTADETVTVRVQGSPTKDAFPKYDALFADGVLDIGIHFGGDYNEGRHDIETAKWLVDLLIEDAWVNDSVKSFDDLKIDSPPFTRTLTIEGREMVVEITVTHSDMVDETEEYKLSDAIKVSLAEKDIVMYSGHAGENAGFIMDYQPRHEIKASEFAEIPMADKYQIYILDGCRTYRTYVDDIMKNPAKNYDNVDIVTTVNTTPFAVGYQMLYQFVYWLTLTNDDGAHFPLSWKAILRGVNTRSFKTVHYGVHGVANNPQLNPHRSQGIACTPCSADNECGAGGNLCLGYPAGNACGVACTHDAACDPGYRCARLVDDPKLFYIPKQCVRRDYACAP